VPNHSACSELWAGSAEMLEPSEWYVPPFSLLELAAVTPEAVAAALERLYADKQHRAAMSLAGYHNATQPEYRWERVAEQWGGLFEGTMDDRRWTVGEGGRFGG
jgi:glycosyltransferase involved in cell wall biosynthesis